MRGCFLYTELLLFYIVDSFWFKLGFVRLPPLFPLVKPNLFVFVFVFLGFLGLCIAVCHTFANVFFSVFIFLSFEPEICSYFHLHPHLHHHHHHHYHLLLFLLLFSPDIRILDLPSCTSGTRELIARLWFPSLITQPFLSFFVSDSHLCARVWLFFFRFVYIQLGFCLGWGYCELSFCSFQFLLLIILPVVLSTFNLSALGFFDCWFPFDWL